MLRKALIEIVWLGNAILVETRSWSLSAAIAINNIPKNNTHTLRGTKRCLVDGSITAMSAKTSTRPRLSGISAAPNAATAPALWSAARHGKIQAA